jgi:hypothetical protein
MNDIVHNIAAKAEAGTREVVHAAGEKTAYMAVSNGAIAGGVGIGAAVSAIVAQMEYRAKKRETKNMMKEEIASITGKDKDKVDVKDLESLSDKSGVVRNHLAKAKKERNVSMGTIFVATMAAVAVVGLLAGGFGGALVAAPGVFGAFAAYGEIGVMAAKLVASVVTFGIVKKPLTKLAEKIFNIDEKTAFDRIESIQKDRESDKVITKDRVMSTFVHANPELEQYIVVTYGKKYDDLNVADKQVLVDTIGLKLGVDKLTDDINKNKIKATELVFAVEGKMSGVLPTAGEKPKQTMLMTIKERLHQVADHMPGHHHEHDQPQRSFVERVARVPMDQVSHVQRVNDSRAAEAAAVAQR